MNDEKRILMRVISRTPAGPDLDKLVAMMLFDMQCEQCEVNEGEYHLVGAQHYNSKTQHNHLCSAALPGFSRDWTYFRVLMEWVTAKYPSVEIVWDSDKWACNMSTVDTQGRWFRIATSAGIIGMQEAVCKAACMSLINPQILPLDIRSRVAIDTPVKKRRKRK